LRRTSDEGKKGGDGFAGRARGKSLASLGKKTKPATTVENLVRKRKRGTTGVGI